MGIWKHTMKEGALWCGAPGGCGAAGGHCSLKEEAGEGRVQTQLVSETLRVKMPSCVGEAVLVITTSREGRFEAGVQLSMPRRGVAGLSILGLDRAGCGTGRTAWNSSMRLMATSLGKVVQMSRCADLCSTATVSVPAWRRRGCRDVCARVY